MGKKLTVYMIDGTAYGPRVSEIGNWVGKAIYSPRTAINKLIQDPNRTEFENPGVYCLKGDPLDDAYEERIYIGEAEVIKNRLKQHLSDSNKDFKELIIFVSKDELLTKTQIKYLEARLVQLAKEAKTAEIDNGTSPSLPRLHEADISDMEYFLEQIKLILPIMGFKFLTPSIIKNNEQELNNQTTPNESKTQQKYLIKTRALHAEMIETDQGYVVLKGSEAKKNLSNSITDTYRKLRKRLIETNILVEKSNESGKLTFSEDTIFNSTSAAANMVLGRNASGPKVWVTEGDLTYKEVQEQINAQD